MTRPRTQTTISPVVAIVALLSGASHATLDAQCFPDPIAIELPNYAPAVGGWSVANHPRLLGDVDGDGLDDIVGFGNAGTYASFSSGEAFSAPSRIIDGFGYNNGSWRVTKNPRMLGDINGDGRLDVVGFANAGVAVSFSTGRSFTPLKVLVKSFGYDAGGWRVGRHPRMLADVDGDGMDDVVGFSSAGVDVSFSQGETLNAPQRLIDTIFASSTWLVSRHPRMLGDVNGDGKDDVVGFADNGVWIALSSGRVFQAPRHVSSAFGRVSGGWQVSHHPRMLADVDGDGKDDIVGFGTAGVYVAFSTSTVSEVSVERPRLMVNSFGYKHGWRVASHPRFMADVNGDGKADVVGFGNAGVHIGLSVGNRFTAPLFAVQGMGANAGNWKIDRHPRMLADVNGDGRSDIVGFAEAGVVALRSRDCPEFRRGDTNDDGEQTIDDVLNLLTGDGIVCDDAADVDNDGAVTVSDAVLLINVLFKDADPPAGYRICAPDPIEPVDFLGCDAHSSCSE